MIYIVIVIISHHLLHWNLLDCHFYLEMAKPDRLRRLTGDRDRRGPVKEGPPRDRLRPAVKAWLGDFGKIKALLRSQPVRKRPSQRLG